MVNSEAIEKEWIIFLLAPVAVVPFVAPGTYLLRGLIVSGSRHPCSKTQQADQGLRSNTGCELQEHPEL